MSEKIYCGSGKIIPTKYGDLTKISFHKDDIQKMVDFMNGGEWINLVLKEKKDKVEGKPTHYLEVDQWKPDGETIAPPKIDISEEQSDLPF